MPFWRLQGRTAVVSGISGTLGRAISISLMGNGVTVYGTTRSQDTNQIDCLRQSLLTDLETSSQRKQLEKLFPAEAEDFTRLAGGIVTCDMATEKSCEEAIKQITMKEKERQQQHQQQQEPRIDLFINCAGITQNKLLARTSQEDLMNIYTANTIAPILLAKSILRHGNMLKQKEGCMIAIGSVVGEDGNAGQVAYSASKGALTSSWKSLAKEFGGKGIRFNVVSPGLVESTMAESISEEKQKMWASQSALGRLVTPDEVSQAVMSCAMNTGMTGQVVRVDCGMK